jgi:CUB/sushi domain-containing protein
MIYFICIYILSEIKCRSPSHPSNGKYSMNGVSVLGNTVSFSCHDGYKLVGSAERICLADRKWSGVQPVCKGKLMFSEFTFIIP